MAQYTSQCTYPRHPPARGRAHSRLLRNIKRVLAHNAQVVGFSSSNMGKHKQAAIPCSNAKLLFFSGFIVIVYVLGVHDSMNRYVNMKVS